jgi:hypothetical protein
MNELVCPCRDECNSVEMCDHRIPHEEMRNCMGGICYAVKTRTVIDCVPVNYLPVDLFEWK